MMVATLVAASVSGAFEDVEIVGGAEHGVARRPLNLRTLGPNSFGHRVAQGLERAWRLQRLVGKARKHDERWRRGLLSEEPYDSFVPRLRP